MKFFTIALLFVHDFVIFRLGSSASIERPESEKPAQAAVIDLRRALSEELNTDLNGDMNYSDTHEHHYEEYEDDYMSGDYGIEIPKVAFSTKPKDPSVFLSTERKRKGQGKKGKGRKRNPCLRKYKDFCIHGICQYLRDLRTASCICQIGYSGERCHLFSLPVAKVEGSYNRTTALAVMAVVLSILCLTIIGILLALRCHKRGAYNVENEEKVKLEMASHH